MSERPVNQHYVPQSYLSRFAVDERIWVFDKFKQKPFSSPTNIRNIASGRYFYDFSKLVTNVKDEQEAENYFSELESEYKELINNVLKQVKNILTNTSKSSQMDILNPQQKVQLSYLVAVQWLRTLESREFFHEFSQKSIKSIFKSILEREFPGENNDFEIALPKNDLLAYHFNQIIKSSDNISKIIRNYIWIIGVNKTNQPLFTSDHPVTMRGYLGYNGFECEGVEITFPINPETILIIFETTHFSKFISLDNKLLTLTPEAVSYYNELQIYNSRRQIYCNENKFYLVKDICTRQPDVCSENKSRIDVISG